MLGLNVDVRILRAKATLETTLAMLDEFINVDVHPSVFRTEKERLQFVASRLSKALVEIEAHVRSQDVHDDG